MIDFNAIPDADLYGMCIQGDEGAWRYMYNYILTICRWSKWDLHEEPEEMAQGITLHLIEKAIGKVKEKNKFRNFVKTVSINKIKDSFKTFRPEASLDDTRRNKKGEEFIPEHMDPKPLHDISLMNLEIVSVIESAIKQLSHDCQKVVNEYLNYKMGLHKDYKELSNVLKMPVPTVSAKVRRCLDKLIKFKEIKELRNF
jgi:RNA polymerase sigma factor (sigma-70 family)